MGEVKSPTTMREKMQRAVFVGSASRSSILIPTSTI